MATATSDAEATLIAHLRRGLLDVAIAVARAPEVVGVAVAPTVLRNPTMVMDVMMAAVTGSMARSGGAG
jgi:hypothetical protein